MGVGKAIAGHSWQGLGSAPTTPPSPPPPPALGLCRSGASSHLAGSPTGITWQDVESLLGQPRVVKELQQHPRPAKGWPWVLRGMAGQGRVVRMGGVAKWPPLLAARPPQLRAAVLAQLPRRAPLSPPAGPTLAG